MRPLQHSTSVVLAVAACAACAALAGCTRDDVTAPAVRAPVRTLSLAKAPGGGAIAALVVSPATVTSGTTAQGTVTLGSAAPAKGTSVALACIDPAVATVPASVTVPRGQTSATFAIATAPTGGASVTITATQGRSTQSASLTVVAPALVGLTLSPTTIAVADTSRGTVTLSGPVADNTMVTITSSDVAVLAPTTVMIPMGMTSASFTVKGLAPASSVTITATLGAETRTATLSVR